MLNRIRKALGLKPRISQAHAHQALYLLRRLEDEFAIPAQHGPDRSPIKASLIYDTQALLYAAGVGTIGCEHIGLNNDGTPIKRPAPPPKPPQVVHTFRPKPRRTPVPAPPPFNPLYGNPAHPWRPPHQPPPAPRPAPQTRNDVAPDRPSEDGDILWLWQRSTSHDGNSPEPARFASGGGGDFSGAGASASWDSSDSGSSSSDSGSSGGGD